MTQAEQIEELTARLEDAEKRLSEAEKASNGNSVEFSEKDAKSIIQMVGYARFDLERVFDYLEAIGMAGSPKRKFNRPQYNEKGERLAEKDQLRAVYSEKTLLTDAKGVEKYHYA